MYYCQFLKEVYSPFSLLQGHALMKNDKRDYQSYLYAKKYVDMIIFND